MTYTTIKYKSIFILPPRKNCLLKTVCVCVCVCVCLFRAAPSAYGGSQARCLIRAVAASLHHSHSNVESEQLMAMPDP